MRGRTYAALGVAVLVSLAGLAATSDAAAGFGAPEVVPDPPPAFWEHDGPAVRYARLGREACEAELARRRVPFAAVGEARGVLAPVRLTGPLHGVTFRTGLPASKRASSPWEIVDCRLALSLDDFAAQLEAHDVEQVIHFSVYRPPTKRAVPEGRLGSRHPGALAIDAGSFVKEAHDVEQVIHFSVYRPPTKRAVPEGRLGSRHPGALAIDAGSFVKKDGTTLEVERDFHGRIGAPTCGPGAGPSPATAEALELRRILCDAADARLFNVMLSPDYNWPHRNHFHLEVTAGARWFVVH